MFIGDLHLDTTTDTLRKFYEKWGKVTECVVAMDKKSKRSRGFGFLTYSRSQLVDECLAHMPHIIDGKQVDPKKCMPREKRVIDPNAPTHEIYVGGFKKDVDESMLQEYFSQYGTVVSVKIMKERKEAQKKKRGGSAFVIFEDTGPADKIVLISTHEIGGNKVKVQKSAERDVKVENIKVEGGVSKPESKTRAEKNARKARKDKFLEQENQSKKDEEISRTDNVLKKRKKSRSKSTTNTGETDVTVGSESMDFGAEPVTDADGDKTEKSRKKRKIEKEDGTAIKEEVKEPYKRKPKAVNQKAYVIFVGNLPFDVGKEDIEKHFGKTGGLKAVRLLTNRDTGKSRGCAYVEFDTQLAHKSGLHLHESMLGGRKINVEFTSRGRNTPKRQERLKEKNHRAARFKRLKQYE